MAINKNHLFEDIDGVKCAVVEAGVSQARVDFLKPLLEGNGFTVIVAPEPSKTPPPATEGTETTTYNPPPTTYKLGVTDVSFNPTNAIFGRLLRTREGRVVTMAYWLQKEAVSNDEVPYFE